MDSVNKLSYYEKPSELAKTNKELKSQLLSLGIDLSDLPDDVNTLLESCAEFRQSTMLHGDDETYILEWFHNKQREQIDNRLIKFHLKAEITEIKEKITKCCNDINILEEVLLNNSTMKSEKEMKKLLAICEKKIENMRQKQKSFKNQSGIDLDEIIEKVHLLEKKQKIEKY